MKNIINFRILNSDYKAVLPWVVSELIIEGVCQFLR